MKIISLYTLILFGLLGHVYAQRPNVLFIPVDDLKPMLGYYGDASIQTPNIDRLAERGTVFLNNACQQAVFGPSRASFAPRTKDPDSNGKNDESNGQ